MYNFLKKRESTTKAKETSIIIVKTNRLSVFIILNKTTIERIKKPNDSIFIEVFIKKNIITTKKRNNQTLVLISCSFMSSFASAS